MFDEAVDDDGGIFVVTGDKESVESDWFIWLIADNVGYGVVSRYGEVESVNCILVDEDGTEFVDGGVSDDV